MRNVFKIPCIITLIFAAAGFTTSAWGEELTKEELKTLTGVVKSKLEDSCYNPDTGKFSGTLSKTKNPKEIYKKIMYAPQGIINEFTISILIRKLSEIAEELFEIAKKQNIANDVIYNDIMQHYWQKKEYKKAIEIFSEALRCDKTNPRSYSIFISGVGKAMAMATEKTKYFKHAQAAFQKFQDREQKMLDELHRQNESTSSLVFVYNAYIKVAGLAGKLEEAQRTFEAANDLLIADDTTYASYITALNNDPNTKFEQINEVFNSIPDALKLSAKHSHTAYITAAGRHEHFQEAQKAFEYASQHRLTDKPMIQTFLNAVRNNLPIAEQYHEASKVWNKIYAHQDKIDTYILSTYLAILSDNDQYLEILDIYQNGQYYRQEDASIYLQYMSAAHRNRNFNLVNEIFDRIRNRYSNTKAMCNAYNIYIASAEDARQYDLAEKAFNEAVKNQKADRITYTSFIVAAGNEEEYEKATDAFNNALKSIEADDPLYNTYINVLIQIKAKDSLETAIKLFEHRYGDIQEFKTSNTNIYDFSRFNFSTAYIACSLLAKKMLPNQEVSIKAENGKVLVINDAINHFKEASGNAISVDYNKTDKKFKIKLIRAYYNETIIDKVFSQKMNWETEHKTWIIQDFHEEYTIASNLPTKGSDKLKITLKRILKRKRKLPLHFPDVNNKTVKRGQFGGGAGMAAAARQAKMLYSDR